MILARIIKQAKQYDPDFILYNDNIADQLLKKINGKRKVHKSVRLHLKFVDISNMICSNMHDDLFYKSIFR